MTETNVVLQAETETDAAEIAHADISAATSNVVPFHRDAEPADHFIVKNGVACAGTHLIIDLVDAEGLADIDLIDEAMRECVSEAGATLLHIHLHPFTPEGVSGVSGVAVLAESHISIHTWPERGYAALDVFMCGDSEPEKCIDVLKKYFRPGEVKVSELLRGSDL